MLHSSTPSTDYEAQVECRVGGLDRLREQLGHRYPAVAGRPDVFRNEVETVHRRRSLSCPDRSWRGRHPTAPASTMLISMSRLISTAYSIGSSLTIGSMNPATIIEVASASLKPRVIR